ncbi:nuclear transport factor 2 family protein [Dyella sp. 2RAF44]|jgi:ketosteroid isomerase-like protein|uniref:YybH family protein n=1 Tax=Dyella sp. 2RAF44 TaxID=3233000 RepID=UPI003F8FC4AF
MVDQAITQADVAEIRALFLRQAAAESAHDIRGIDAVLARALPGQSDPVNFVARAYRFWGREAVLEHFRSVFEGTWRFEPEMEEIKVLPISADVAHIFAPTNITTGLAGGSETTYRFLVNEFAVRTHDGWRIASIVPVPAQ